MYTVICQLHARACMCLHIPSYSVANTCKQACKYYTHKSVYMLMCVLDAKIGYIQQVLRCTPHTQIPAHAHVHMIYILCSYCFVSVSD